MNVQSAAVAGVPPLLPTATGSEAVGIVAGVLGPTLAKGVIIRRPRVVALVELFDLDTGAVRRMQRLLKKYAPGPLLIGPVRQRHGGHLIEGVVRPTLEIVVTETPAYLRRRFDPQSGLPLVDPG